MRDRAVVLDLAGPLMKMRLRIELSAKARDCFLCHRVELLNGLAKSSGSGSLGQFAHDFVHITPRPVLARLNRADHRMPGVMKMLGGMFVLGRIAATHVAALRAHSQMDPGVAGFNTFLTNVSVRAGKLDFGEMTTRSCHGNLL